MRLFARTAAMRGQPAHTRPTGRRALTTTRAVTARCCAQSASTSTLISIAPLNGATPRASVAVGGHRGLGQNPLPLRAGDDTHSTPATPPPPHRENTVASLRAAAAAGATFVEVDAQVTADGVAVLWHDDFVLVRGSRGPTAVPISALTLAEFKALNLTRAGALVPPAPSLSSSDAEGWASDGHLLLRSVRGSRGVASTSMRPSRRAAPPAAAAPWEVAADDALPTLAEALAALPPGLGVNIEVNASSLGGLATATTAGSGMGGRAARAEAARTVAGVLAASSSSASRRPLLFSSFDTRLAGGLRAAQGAAPVFLLTEEASPAVGLAAARLGLQGVVVDAAALLLGGGDGDGDARPPTVLPPDTTALARPPGARLRLASYGAVNDRPDVVAAQAAAGVEAVIVDDVAAVVRGLTGGGLRERG